MKSSQKGQLNDVSFTPGKICNVLKKLKTKFSSGPDGVPSVFFKQLADVLCWPLSFVFDASFKAGVLPACWLDAIVTPVFKKVQHLNLKIIVQFHLRAFVVGLWRE